MIFSGPQSVLDNLYAQQKHERELQRQAAMSAYGGIAAQQAPDYTRQMEQEEALRRALDQHGRDRMVRIVEANHKPQPKTVRDELQAEVDEWLKDTI